MARKRTTTSRVASSRVVDDFKIIHGIGPLYEKHLRDAGIRMFAQLAKLSPEDVATHIPNLSASKIRKQGWVLQARKLASKKTEVKSPRKKPTISTTRQHYENFTVEFLLNEKNKLRRLRIMHVQSGDVETWANWRQEEVSHFLARHTGVRFPKEKNQKQDASTAEPKSGVKAPKSAMSAKSKTKRRSSKQKSAKPKNKTRPKKSPRIPETISDPKEKKVQAKSTQPKLKVKRSRISAQRSVKSVVPTPSKKISQKPEILPVPKAKKIQDDVTQIRTMHSRSRAPKSVKPIVKTPPTEISQKPEAPSVPKVGQVRAKSMQPKARQNEQLAPILFRPAAEVLPKRFLQKSKISPIPEEDKNQTGVSIPEAPQAVREPKSQTGVIRLLNWNVSRTDSDQSVQSLPHDQNFDVKLTLDISSLPITTKSQLDITGTLLAKRLGSHERMMIGETQMVIPYSPIIDLSVGKAVLEQGLYRLEAQIKLNDSEVASLQGDLFQVY